MKVLFDIIHPGNVHYFKHTIRKLINEGNEILVTARDKEVSLQLLEAEGINYVKMGKNPKSTFGKVLFLILCEIKTFMIFRKYKPDLCLSFGASYIAHNCYLFNKSHVSFDDTEHASLNRKLYMPFTEIIFTPESYNLNLGVKQIRFPGHMELFYLSKKYFSPDNSVFEYLGIKPSVKYIVFRFVSWNALHDKGQGGFSTINKINIIKELSKKYKIFISAEGIMPDELENLRINIPPSLIHHVLYYAELFIGEGATMASECAAIGTPAIYVNSLNAGTLEYQEEMGLIYNLRDDLNVLEIANQILNNPNSKEVLRKKLEKLNDSRIELTDFLVWFIVNFPKSKGIVLSNDNWKDRFILKK